jgi:hypothetical protein
LLLLKLSSLFSPSSVEAWIGFIPLLIERCQGCVKVEETRSLILMITKNMYRLSHIQQLLEDQTFLNLKKQLSQEDGSSEIKLVMGLIVILHLLTIEPTLLSLDSFEWLRDKRVELENSENEEISSLAQACFRNL